MTGSEIKTELSRIIDDILLDSNPSVIDDDTANLLVDGDKRDEAIDRLIKMIELYRGEL